ncbi:MAG: hypothetical protein KF696_16340 [Planctomycetes bacterium]|nr:hypothetical protein [Planctomycetota bacterium]
MSTITCGSCGMQYDGSGLQAGVQFQCTQCGSMVQVGGGASRPTGVQRKGPGKTAGPKAAGRPRAAGGPPQRRAAGPVMGQPGHDPNQQQAPYGAPRKKSNAGLFVGLGVGLVVIVLIVVIVVASSGPTPQQAQQASQDDAKKKREEEQARRDAETTKKNEELTKSMQASKAMGRKIEAALRGSDAAGLEGMFDWRTYALYNGDLVKNNPDFMNSSPLIVDGDWEKLDNGKYSGKYVGRAVRGPDSLKSRLMGFFGNYFFGAEITWDEERTNHEKSAFSLSIGGTDYLGVKVFIDVKNRGKLKEFWVGAPRGSDQAKVINFVDPGALKTLQEKEAKNERDPRTDDRDPTNPDRDPTNPNRTPRDPGPDERTDPTDNDPDADLPPVAKTGASPSDPALANAVNELKRNALNEARKDTVRKHTSKTDKKATMGAIIDVLIDAVKSGDRNLKHNASKTLYDIWKSFSAADWKREDLVYDLEFGGGQNDKDDIVRRWLWTYQNYPTN